MTPDHSFKRKGCHGFTVVLHFIYWLTLGEENTVKKKDISDQLWYNVASCSVNPNLLQKQTCSFVLQPYFVINAVFINMILACCVKWQLRWCLFSSSHTWRTTWRTRTVWSVSGRPCAPTRQSPVPAVWGRASRTPRGIAQTPSSYVSPFKHIFSTVFSENAVVFVEGCFKEEHWITKPKLHCKNICVTKKSQLRGQLSIMPLWWENVVLFNANPLALRLLFSWIKWLSLHTKRVQPLKALKTIFSISFYYYE